MNKSLDIKKIPDTFQDTGKKILGHAKFIFIIIVLCLSGFLVFQINNLINSEPTDEQVSTQLQTIKRPKIDQDTISKIEKLEDQNVGVQALFKTARDNPFQD